MTYRPLRSAWALPKKTGTLTRLRKSNGRDEGKNQVRASGGLAAYSDLGDEHGRCPWRCLCVTTALDVRISADIILLKEFYLEWVRRG
jgi:hypothetical protein